MKHYLLAATALSLVPAHALAQTAQPTPPPSGAGEVSVNDDEVEEIVVTGQRERGAVVGDIKPELQLNAADVRALGV